MFEKMDRTQFPPKDKPLLIWDGNCGFCKYWVSRWESFTGNKVNYVPYQEAAAQFPDIDIQHFKKASRLIETDGRIFSGPRSAYRTFTYGSKWAFLDRWYEKYPWFEKWSDRRYVWIEGHRSLLFKVTKYLFGSNPLETRPFWAIYLAILLYIVYVWLLE